MAKPFSSNQSSCPCGSNQPYPDCCGRYLDGGYQPPTAEALMRSRYAAYVLQSESYLLATWHPSTRPRTLDLHSQPAPQWLGLNVVRHDVQSTDSATVEFVARYKINGRAFKLHEHSRFVRESGHWMYLDGDELPG